MRQLPVLACSAILSLCAASYSLPGLAADTQPPVGEAKVYTPFVHVDLDRGMRLELPLSVAGTTETVTRFPVDRLGSRFGGPSASPVIRVGARFDTGMAWAPVAVLAETEVDLLTGTWARDPDLAGQGFPGGEGRKSELRKLHVRASFGTALHLDVGAQTSHFGMGLVSNDGAHGWEPGSAQFSDPRSGNRVLRAQLSTGPHTLLHLALALGADKVLGDATLLAGDSARQFFGVLLFGLDQPTSAGVYVLRRHQQNEAGRTTDVTVIDLTAKTTIELRGAVLGFETEWAVVRGTTQLGPTFEHPTHDVRQLGGAARASVDLGALGMVLDFLYASGDKNPYDGTQNAFHVDPNYASGLLLYRQVLAAQSARTAGFAGDPLLVGVAQDVDRVPTRGGASNTIAIFPRVRYRILAGLEVYGGPLFAFAAAPNLDLFNTELAGGAPRTSLGGVAGRYLGTELDLGLRYRALVSGSELTVGAEGGALSPGSGFRSLDNTPMRAVYGGRVMLRYRF